MKTIEEFRQGGGYTARVPGDITHIITRPKEIRSQGPDGIVTTHIGPETISTEIVLENGQPVRVVRFHSIVDFKNLRSSVNGAGLEWEKLNPELCRRLFELSRPNQLPGAIRG